MLTVRQAWIGEEEIADIAIDGDRIVGIGAQLPTVGDEIDGRGMSALPGLHDHHLHILALAARRHSVDLRGADSPAQIRAMLAAAAPGPDGWIRAVNYHERVTGLPDAAMLDGWCPAVPLRVQDRTGALWILNGPGLRRIGDRPLPSGAEQGADGRPTGRFWREDEWLRSALPACAPMLADLGEALARLGLVALTDASATNGPEAAATLGGAQLSGALPQRLTLMGNESLEQGAGYRVGPLKLLIDERDPPPIDELIARIGVARAQSRPVAAHCVTDTELALFLAALAGAGGSLPGDRIEHGGLITSAALTEIADRALTVATNPAFLHDRGDGYLRDVPPERWNDLYRARSILAAGVDLMAGSDAPYASVDPWLAMRTARGRMTANGKSIAAQERLTSIEAWRLYAGPPLAVGGPADLLLCQGKPGEILNDLDGQRLCSTIVAGRLFAS